jgi:drug/metabolite transporter (DMT)-like permease
MNWLNLALIGTVALGLVNILDSHLVSQRLPGIRAFLLPLGCLFLVYGGVLGYLFPLPENLGVLTLAMAAGTGLVRAAAILLMFYLLRYEDVSQVIPITYAYPILVAIGAVPLFGESLSYWNWLAILVVVGGAVLIAPGLGQTAGKRVKAVWLLLGTAVLFAGIDLTSKFALGAVSSWSLLWMNLITLSVIFLAISLRPKTLQQLQALPQKKWAAAILLGDFALSMTGFLFILRAIESGPIALVSTISGSRPIFVLFFALVIGRFWPSFIKSRRTWGGLWLRLVATVMVVGGIATIYLVR